MNDRIRILAAVGATVLLFLGVQLGALALIEPFQESELQAVENPDDPTNSLLYIVAILVMTGLMLAAFKYNAQRLIRGLIIGVSVLLAWFVFAELLPPLIAVGSIGVLPLVAAFAVGAGLLFHPEWYVIDTAGVVMGAGAAGLFGISFGLFPAIVLLSVLAVYDAISVYKTKHMLSLAEGVMDLKIPVVFVIPTTLSYSYLSSGRAEDDGEIEDRSSEGATAAIVDEQNAASGKQNAASDEQPHGEGGNESPRNDEKPDPSSEAAVENPDEAGARDALFIGLGDAVIPTILVASAAFFIDEGTLDVPGILLNVPALGAMGGTLVGLLVLLYMVLQGRPHAGLPLLNSGAIGGYVLGALASGLSIATMFGL